MLILGMATLQNSQSILVSPWHPRDPKCMSSYAPRFLRPWSVTHEQSVQMIWHPEPLSLPATSTLSGSTSAHSHWPHHHSTHDPWLAMAGVYVRVSRLLTFLPPAIELLQGFVAKEPVEFLRNGVIVVANAVPCGRGFGRANNLQQWQDSGAPAAKLSGLSWPRDREPWRGEAGVPQGRWCYSSISAYASCAASNA